MAVDPDSGALFVGTAGHGLWSTADQGASWRADLAGRSVYAIVLSERGRIYLGTQDGLHFSSDGGASWQRLPSPAVHGKMMALAIRSGSPDALYASIAGRPIQCSVDGGATWRSLQHMPPGVNVTALAVDPLSPAHLYVGTDQGLWRCTLPADADSSASG
jgi:ligand-binding sensor domain-containing protein